MPDSVATARAPKGSTTEIASGDAPGRRRRTPADWLPALAKWALPLALLVGLGIVGITTPGFATVDNIRAILIGASVVGIIAVGMTPVTLSGNIFSLGISASTVLAAMIFLSVTGATKSIAIGVLAATAVLLVLGAVQGLVIAMGLNPIITTLAVGAIVSGILSMATGSNYVTSGSVPVTWLATTNLAGLPVPVYVFILYAAAMWFVIERTVVGRQVLLLGSNKKTAAVSGISKTWVTVWAFLSMSLGIAIGAVFAAAQFSHVTSTDLPDLTMNVIAAVIVGGNSVGGGSGSPIRSALGAVLIVTLGNIMLLHSLPTGARTAGTGLLVIVVIITMHLLRKGAAK